MTSATPPAAAAPAAPTFGDRLWNAAFGSSWGGAVFRLLLLALVLTPKPSFAAGLGGAPGGAGFDSLGQKLGGLFCEFLGSPIITVALGVAILGLLLLAALNEDNGLLSKFLKTMVAGVVILFIPSLLSMLGFDLGCTVS